MDSYGRGAGARFRTDAPRQRFAWGDMSFVERRAARAASSAVGRGGKYNRIKTFAEWTLEPAGRRHARSSSCSRPSRRCRPTA